MAGGAGCPALAAPRARPIACRPARAGPRADEGRDPQPPDRDLALPGRGHRRRRRDPRRGRHRARRASPRPAWSASRSATCTCPAPTSRGRRSRQARRTSPARCRSCSTGRSAAPRSTTSSAGRRLGGYFRTFEQTVAGVQPRLPQADHDRRRPGQHRAGHRRQAAASGRHAAGAARRAGHAIGMGGGAASSMAPGASTRRPRLRLGAARQPRDPAPRQEVINHCWALGDANPILSIHDVGAGGLSNAFPELVDGGGKGARFDLRAIPSGDPAMAPAELWCNEAQERYVVALAPAARPSSRRCAPASARRGRSGPRHRGRRTCGSTTRCSARRRSTCRST
jgi:hypothetical protein